MPKNKPAIILFLLALAIRLFFVVFLPFGQKVQYKLEGLNDEPAHYNYVRFLVKHKKLPVLVNSVQAPDAFEKNDFENYQPPIYYVLGAFLHGIAGERHSVFVLRLFSFLFGLGCIYLIIINLRQCGASMRVQLCGGLFVSLVPGHAYFCSLVSNDSISWFFALLLTYECIGYQAFFSKANLGPPLSKAIRIGLYLALGLLTKSSILLFPPLVAGTLIYGYYKTKNNQFLKHLLLIITVCAGPVLVWYIRNLILYNSLTVIEIATGPAYRNLFTFHEFADFLKLTVRFFWFPMQHIPPGPITGMFGHAGALILLFHGILAVKFFSGKRQWAFHEGFLLCLLILNLAGFVKINLHWNMEEGRYLFPSLAALAYFFLVPLEGLLKKLQKEHYLIIETAIIASFSYLQLCLV